MTIRTRIRAVALAIALTSLVPWSARAYYNPNVGRWLSRDPIGEWGGLNLFAASVNNPICYFDALGFEVWVVDGKMDYGPTIDEWNKGIDEKKKAVRDFISAIPATEAGKYKYYWYTYGAGKWSPEEVAKEEFLNRLKTEIVHHAPSEFKNLAGDKKLVEVTVKKHTHAWDSTGYAHHTSGENKADFTDGPVDRGTVEAAITPIAPSKGKLVYSSCVGSGTEGRWKELHRLNLVYVSPSYNAQTCRVKWYAVDLRNEVAEPKEPAP